MKLIKIITGLATLVAVESKALYYTNKDYNASRHNINGSDFFLSEYDFGGIGTSGSRTVTAISPEWGIGARHYTASGTVTFNSGEQTVIDYTISPPSISGEDLVLYHFKTPLQDTKTYDLIQFPNKVLGSNNYPILNGFHDFFYVGKSPRSSTVQAVGMTKNMSQNMDGGSSWSSPLVYDFYGQFPDAARGVSGDSGAPTFLPVGDELYLAGVHWGPVSDGLMINKGSEIEMLTGLTNKAWMYDDALVRDTTPDVPEPTSLIPLALGAGLLGRRKRK